MAISNRFGSFSSFAANSRDPFSFPDLSRGIALRLHLVPILEPLGLTLHIGIPQRTIYICPIDSDHILYEYGISDFRTGASLAEILSDFQSEKTKNNISIAIDKGLEDGEQWATELVETIHTWL